MERKIDIKLVKKILDEYEEQYEYSLPEELELSEKQEQFLRGYLHVLAKEESDDGKGRGCEEKDDEVRQRILKVRSKYCERILELLFSEGEIYHGDLADKLKLSPSGLNAIIKKMQEDETYLIDMMQIGKYKIYMLPKDVKKYMEKKENRNNNKNKSNVPSSSNLLLGLQRFVEMVDSEWKEILSLLLQGEDDEIDENIKNYFSDFMVQVQWAEKYDEYAFQELKRVLKNDILIYLVDEYLEVIKECESIREEIGQRKNGKRLLRHIVIK